VYITKFKLRLKKDMEDNDFEINFDKLKIGMIIGRDCDSIVYSSKYWLEDLNQAMNQEIMAYIPKGMQIDENFISLEERELCTKFIEVCNYLFQIF
jgi:hypothetical protein